MDARKNFSITTITKAPSPATSGTSLQVASVAHLPAAPFNLVVWPVEQRPEAGNAEIVRVTNIAGTTLTVARAQESSTARAILVGDQAAQMVTNLTLKQIEEAITALGTDFGIIAGAASALQFASVSRPTVGIGITGHSSPSESDFTSFNELVSPRSIDALLLFTTLETDPPYYAAWAAWAKTFDATLLLTMSPEASTLHSFAAGTHDTSGLYNGEGLAGLAKRVAELDTPVLFRLAHEFNLSGSSYGYEKETAKQYVEGWQHIVNVFRANGAANAQWVWCANIWGDASTVDPTAADGSGASWYPGDDYVDVLSLDGYQKQTSSKIFTPAELFLGNYQTLCQLTEKPFAITEVGCAKDARFASSGVGSKANWYTQFFQMVRNDMPRCILVVNWERQEPAKEGKPEEDDTIDSSGTDLAAKGAFIEAITAPPFVTAPGVVPSKPVPLPTNLVTVKSLQTLQGAVTPTGSGDFIGNIRDLYVPSDTRPPRPMAVAEVSTFQSGHGFTIQGGTPGTISDDTVIFGMGSQSLKIKTTGEAGKAATIVGKTGLTSIDLTTYDLRLRLRVEHWARIKRNGIRIRFGSDLSANYKERFFGPLEAQETVSAEAKHYELYGGDGEWQDYTIDAGLLGGGSAGTITLSAITAIGIYIQDTEEGTAAEVHIQEIALVPKAKGPYPNGVVTFTFDDGYQEQWTNAKPRLDRYGYPATAFVIADLIGEAPGTYMSLAELGALEQQSGWEIACHSLTAEDHNATGGFTGITAAELDDNLTGQKSWMLANGFRGKDYTAYPQGFYNDAVIKAMKRYFTAARTVSGTDGFETFPPADPMRVRCVPFFDTTATQAAQETAFKKLVDECYENGGWLIFYCHRVKTEPSGIQVTPTTFNGVVDHVAAKEIPVRTFGDVIRASGSALATAVSSSTPYAKKAGIYQPSYQGWKATPGHPALFSSAAVPLEEKKGRVMVLFGTPGEVCEHIEFNLSKAGATITNPFMAVYNSAGVQLAKAAAPVYTGSGAQKQKLDAPFTIPTDGIVVVIVGVEKATTYPEFTGASIASGLTAFAYPAAGRNALVAEVTGISAAPGSLEMQSLTVSTKAPWLAASA